MEFFASALDSLLHLDVILGSIAEQYGALTYAILFFIITAETGLIIAPFLPGDSLLFAIGAFSARGIFDPFVMFAMLSVAAILGDAINYAIGSKAGEKLLGKNYSFMKEEYLHKTKLFYERWGGQTIILARFLPIVRTFAPFLAGVAKMPYSRFSLFNVVGSLLWVGSFLTLGHFFGNLPIIKDNFGLIILGAVGITFLPGLIQYLSGRRKKNTDVL